MPDNKYRFSNVGIIKRVPKTPSNPYGALDVERVASNKPAIVAFGGEYTLIAQSANYYASLLESIIGQGSESNIYSVYYDFGSREAGLDRKDAFRRAGRKVERLAEHDNANAVHMAKLDAMIKNELVSNITTKLYQAIITPRLIDKDNRPMDSDQVAHNMSGLTLWGHSHGPMEIMNLGQYMRDQMKVLGYTPAQIKHIQSNILAICHAPIVPLDKATFTTLSFGSADDTRMDHYNPISRWLLDNSMDVVPAYFGEKLGNFFVSGNTKVRTGQEHEQTGLRPDEDALLTEDGRIIYTAERNAIANAVIRGAGKPDVEKLVSGKWGGIDFKQLRLNGDALYKLMLADLRQQIPKHDYQK